MGLLNYQLVGNPSDARDAQNKAWTRWSSRNIQKVTLWQNKAWTRWSSRNIQKVALQQNKAWTRWSSRNIQKIALQQNKAWTRWCSRNIQKVALQQNKAWTRWSSRNIQKVALQQQDMLRNIGSTFAAVVRFSFTVSTHTVQNNMPIHQMDVIAAFFEWESGRRYIHATAGRICAKWTRKSCMPVKSHCTA